MSDSPDQKGRGLGPQGEVPRRGTPRLRRLLRDLHHQTWEPELLISGLVAFGLLQLPGPLDQLQRLAWTQGPAVGGILGMLVLTYLKLAVYTLLLAFGIHVVVRALWVGLVGLDSIFPRGMRMDRLDISPVVEDLTRTRIPSVRQLIVQADALAAIPVVAILLATGYAVASLLPGRVDEMQVFWAAWGVFLLVAVVPGLVDRFAGHRLREGGLPRRILRALLLFVILVTGSRIYSPVFNTLAELGDPARGYAGNSPGPRYYAIPFWRGQNAND